MEYQDKKIRAIGRVIVISAVLAILLTLTLLYPVAIQEFVQHLPRFRRSASDGYYILLSVFIFMSTTCWGGTLALIFTTPEQEARFVKWSKRWRKAPIKFEEQEFDLEDPNYRKVTWRYYLDRLKTD